MNLPDVKLPDVKLPFHILIAIFALLLVASLSAPASAQPVQRSPEGKIAETYIKKVMAANGANSPVPVPTAAERAALKTFNATVNANDELEIKNWPPTALGTVKSVGQLNGIMGQLENMGIYKTRADANARDATRKEQLAQVKTRTETLSESGSLAKDVRITTTQEQQFAMRRLGYALNAANEIAVGDKRFSLADAIASELTDLSEPGRKKFGAAYAKGADAVDAKLANPKLGFVEKSQLEEAKQERDAHIAATHKLLTELRQKLSALDKSNAAQPAKKK